MFDSSGPPKISKTFDIFSTYFSYVQDTEPPLTYHRWCLLSSLATLLGRKVWIDHGHFKVYPNLYVTLVGEPAARKSTSIKILKRLLRQSGYETFAADKTSKEKFLLDLEGFIEPGTGYEIAVKNPKFDSVTSSNLWGSHGDETEVKEVYIAADEFSEFTGSGNLEFYTTLGNLWDWDDSEKPFVQRLKNSRSVSIYQPTINILSGTTAELFSKIFPAEAIGSGFLSRLILIYGERSGRKIAFPKPPDGLLEEQIVKYFQYIGSLQTGQVPKTSGAEKVLTSIYESEVEIDDVRFKGYSNRRFTQLLKLSLILCVSRFGNEIEEQDVIRGNTILTCAEFLMPKAIGEFGKSRNSDVASKILGRLEQAEQPLSIKELWKYVNRDLDKQQQLMEIIQSLLVADKIQVARGIVGMGYLPKKAIRKQPAFVDWSLLTSEEKQIAGVIER